MPLPISSVAIQEKNKLASTSLWILALKIVIPGYGTIRVADTRENVTWDGETWAAFPFQIEEVTDSASSEVQRVVIRVSNVSRALDAYIQTYDNYIKANGHSPLTVDIYLLNSLNLGSAVPEVWHRFQLKKPETSSMWATFTLSVPDISRQRFPPSRFLKATCRFRFKDRRCKYVGAETVCGQGTGKASHSFDACDAHGNTENFGGFPGIGFKGLRLG
jgi:phage-related protein